MNFKTFKSLKLSEISYVLIMTMELAGTSWTLASTRISVASLVHVSLYEGGSRQI